TREALAFGVGVPLPTRLIFPELPPGVLPKSDTFANDAILQASGGDLNFIASVVDRWRNATMNRTHTDEPRAGQLGAPGVPPAPPRAAARQARHPPSEARAARAARVGDPTRLNLLKKPPADRPDPLAALRAFQASAAQRTG